MLGRTPAVDRLFDALRQDLRSALRAIRHSPGFTAVVTLTLAIGIGANAAIVSLLHTVLLGELPVTDPTVNDSGFLAPKSRTRLPRPLLWS